MMTSELLLLYASTVVTVNAEDATCIVFALKTCSCFQIFGELKFVRLRPFSVFDFESKGNQIRLHFL